MPRPAGRRGRPPHPDVLTPAEWRVLNLLRHGLSNRRIAFAPRHIAGRREYHVGQVGMTVTDIERAVSFYGDILGLPLLGNYGSIALFDCGGMRLFLSLPEGNEPSRSSIVYFRTEDIEAAYGELQRRGVDFEGAPHMIHRHDSGVEEWMAFFRDPDGNALALMSQIAPSA